MSIEEVLAMPRVIDLLFPRSRAILGKDLFSAGIRLGKREAKHQE
jgi:hypothetical protein